MPHRSPVDRGPTTTLGEWVAWFNGPAKDSRLAALKGQPGFGVFFYVEGAVVGFPETPTLASVTGPHAHPKRSHATAWPLVLARVGPLARARKDLAAHYPVFPRGRVLYQVDSDRYQVLVSPSIPPAAYPAILAEFGLTGHPVTFDTSDPHYVMQADDLATLETAVAVHRLR